MLLFKILQATLFLLLTCLPLQALCLRNWLGGLQTGNSLAYRSGNQVGVVQLKSKNPCEWETFQVDSTQFFSHADWASWAASQAQLSHQSSELWQLLLDLPLQPSSSKRLWHPKLALLAPANQPISWRILEAKLPPNHSLPENFRTLTLYVAEGPGLIELGLPSPWPYWIENHETLHKWVAYLIAVDKKSDNLHKN